MLPPGCPFSLKSYYVHADVALGMADGYSSQFALCGRRLCVNNWVAHPLTSLLFDSLSPEHLRVNKLLNRLAVQTNSFSLPLKQGEVARL